MESGKPITDLKLAEYAETKIKNIKGGNMASLTEKKDTNKGCVIFAIILLSQVIRLVKSTIR